MTSSNVVTRRRERSIRLALHVRVVSRAARGGVVGEMLRSRKDTFHRSGRSQKRSRRVGLVGVKAWLPSAPRRAAACAWAVFFAFVAAPDGGPATAEETRQVIRRGHVINAGAGRGSGPARTIEPPIFATLQSGATAACHSLDQIAHPVEVKSVWIHAPRFRDRNLDFLTRTPQLEELTLPGFWDATYSQITDRGLENISRLRCLRHLSLGSNRITDRGLACLAELRSLEFLDLRSSSVTDNGIALLGNLQTLITLRLRVPLMTDFSLVQLARLENLVHLDLYGTSVTGHGFAPLEGRPPLLIDLSGAFTDEGLTCIAGGGAPGLNLVSLTVVGRQVSDKGLAAIARISRLRFLSLYDTRATAEGVAEFRRAKPLMAILTVVNDGRRPFWFAEERLSGTGRAAVSRRVHAQGVPALRMGRLRGH